MEQIKIYGELTAATADKCLADAKQIAGGYMALTTEERTSLTKALLVEGMRVYDTDLKTDFRYTDGKWVEITDGTGTTDYDKLNNKPIQNQDLTLDGFEPVDNTYYRHTGETTETFTQGLIYLYSVDGYKPLDGSGSGESRAKKYNVEDYGINIDDLYTTQEFSTNHASFENIKTLFNEIKQNLTAGIPIIILAGKYAFNNISNIEETDYYGFAITYSRPIIDGETVTKSYLEEFTFIMLETTDDMGIKSDYKAVWNYSKIEEGAGGSGIENININGQDAPIQDNKAILNTDRESILYEQDIEGNLLLKLPDNWITAIKELIYKKPTLKLSGIDSAVVEYGATHYINSFKHIETNIDNIADYNISLLRDNQTALPDIVAKEELTEVELGDEQVITNNIVYKLFAQDTYYNNLYSNSITISSYKPVFAGTSKLDELKDVGELTKIASNKFGNIKITARSDDEYAYFVTFDEITKVTSSDFAVPIDTCPTTTVIINDQQLQYNVYRTSSKLIAGEHSFTVYLNENITLDDLIYDNNYTTTIDVGNMPAGTNLQGMSLRSILDTTFKAEYVTSDGGLYDEFDNMLLSWDESGIDLSVDYDATTYATGNSAYRIITEYNNSHETKIAKVVIPAESQYIKLGDYSFYNTALLKSVVIPETVSCIGHHTFDSCTSLASVEMPASILQIEEYAFKSCTSLQTIALSANLEEIFDSAFEGCARLEYIGLPSNVKSIAKNTFKECTNLSNIYFANDVSWYLDESSETLYQTSIDVSDSQANADLLIGGEWMGKYLHRSENIPSSELPIYLNGHEAIVNTNGFTNWSSKSDQSIYDKVDDIEYGVLLNEELDRICIENNNTGIRSDLYLNGESVLDGSEIFEKGEYSTQAEAVPCRVTFIANGKEYKIIDVQYDSLIPEDERDVPEGYTYWSDDKANPFDFDNTPILDDTTLFAV